MIKTSFSSFYNLSRVFKLVVSEVMI